MEEQTIRSIVDKFTTELSDAEKNKILKALLRNDAMDAIYEESQDSFGHIYSVTCPSCGGSLEFNRFSEMVRPFNYCYYCGQKLFKKVKNDEEVREKDDKNASN